MGVVIDTGVFIGWEREGGIHRENTDGRRAKRSLFVSTVLSNVVVSPIDSKVADIHAELVAALSQNGTTIGPHDNWIAATALTYDYDFACHRLSE